MKERKCVFCGKKAFAYRMEADGSRTYLCMKHIPDEETTRLDEKDGPPVPWPQSRVKL